MIKAPIEVYARLKPNPRYNKFYLFSLIFKSK